MTPPHPYGTLPQPLMTELAWYSTRIRSKRGHWLWSVVGWFSEKWRDRMWNTYRLPFCQPVIWVAALRDLPLTDKDAGIIAHELRHVAQCSSFLGLWWTVLLNTILPLPALFSGRWFVERRPYLLDIRNGRKSIDSAVNLLWASYGWCWPKPLMRRWFERHQENPDAVLRSRWLW